MLLEIDCTGKIINKDSHGIADKAYLRTDLKERYLWLKDRLAELERQKVAPEKLNAKGIQFRSEKPRKKIRPDKLSESKKTVLVVSGGIIEQICRKEKEQICKILLALTHDFILIEELKATARQKNSLIEQGEFVLESIEELTEGSQYFNEDELERIIQSMVEQIKMEFDNQKTEPVLLIWNGKKESFEYLKNELAKINRVGKAEVNKFFKGYCSRDFSIRFEWKLKQTDLYYLANELRKIKVVKTKKLTKTGEPPTLLECTNRNLAKFLNHYCSNKFSGDCETIKKAIPKAKEVKNETIRKKIDFIIQSLKNKVETPIK